MEPLLLLAAISAAGIFVYKVNRPVKKSRKRQLSADERIEQTLLKMKEVQRSNRIDPLDASTIGPGIYDDIDPEDIMLFAKKTITSCRSESRNSEPVKTEGSAPLLEIGYGNAY